MRYNKLFIGALCLATAFGCNKVIDIEETDLIAGPIALKTVENCEAGVIGAYANVSTDMSVLLNSVFSDEIKQSEFYNAQTTHEWAYTPSDIGIRDNYTAITPNGVINDRVNRVLEALPVADSMRAGDNVLRNKLRGEALFLRAYAHFELFRFYCGNYAADGLAMPYMEKSSLDPQARTDMATYFSKLKADLAEAKTLVPQTITNINRANKFAVTALQARVALYQKDWAAAEAFATEFINAIPLSPIDQYAAMWKDQNANEVAYRIVKTTGLSRLGSLYRASNSGATIGTVTWQPSDKIWNSFDQANDVRFGISVRDEPKLTALNRPSRLVAKYEGTGMGTTTDNVANAKVFRTGEMVLIRAEARAEQDKFTGANSAESDLNMLRTARIDGYTPVTLASKAVAITEIMNERFRELAFEGHRFFDLRRKSLPVARLASDAPNPTAATLPANDFRFLLPIPLTELQANRLMKQNPGYPVQ